MHENLSDNPDPLTTTVIVNYETSTYVKRCIETLREQDIAWEAIVVDNPSPENDYQNLSSASNVRIVKSSENVGYGLGCNLGAASASSKSRYICILNPDTAVPRGQLKNWIASYEKNCPDGGILGPALLNDNGTTQRSNYAFYNGLNYWLTHSLLAGFLINRKKGSWTGGKGHGFSEAVDLDESEKASEGSNLKARETDWLMGAALLMDRHTWNKLIGFSDRYFLYSEDTDLCWRCRDEEMPVVYDPSVRIWHTQGDPAAGAARETGIVRLFDGMKRFVDSNYTGFRKTGVYISVVLDMVLRLAVLSPLLLIRKNDVLLESRLRGYNRVFRQWVGQE